MHEAMTRKAAMTSRCNEQPGHPVYVLVLVLHAGTCARGHHCAPFCLLYYRHECQYCGGDCLCCT